jgi:hypothetical protein
MSPSRPGSARYKAAATRLRELYARRGSVRVPDEYRRRNETWQTYKHGYELHFHARDRYELNKIQGLLRTVGVEAGRSFKNSGVHTLPIYGTERVLRTILDLRLTPKPRRRRPAPTVRPALRGRPPAVRPVTWPTAYSAAVEAIADRRQRKIVVRLANRGPLTAKELSAAGSQLARMRRLGIVAALPKEGNLPRVWALTVKGMREARRWRKA